MAANSLITVILKKQIPSPVEKYLIHTVKLKYDTEMNEGRKMKELGSSGVILHSSPCFFTLLAFLMPAAYRALGSETLTTT